jgi:hypothetical protein
LAIQDSSKIDTLPTHGADRISALHEGLPHIGSDDTPRFNSLIVQRSVFQELFFSRVA